jgi:hypothetical protein
MTPHIDHLQLPAEPGTHIIVTLQLSPDEEHLIWNSGMEDLNIVTWKGKEHPFSEFYNPDTFSTTQWPQDGDVWGTSEARNFIRLLKIGFRQFEDHFMRENRKPMDYEVPWNFFDKFGERNDPRMAHMWVPAQSDMGKTTFLSAMIDADLEKVKRGEASVLIIDSENERLGNNLPHAARFAPGGDLEGKLIYLTPSLKYPPRFNILDFAGYHDLDEDGQFHMLTTVREMLTFFIGTLFGETSAHMQNIIDYAFRALLLIPEPSVGTFKELLTKGGLGKLTAQYPQLKTLDEDTAEFLSSRMFTQYTQSISAVWTRLDGITRNEFTKRSFAQPQNTLRLYDLLTEPHVIIVNTDKFFGEEAPGTFGRFILASLYQVVRKRVDGGLPCYVYVDEAHQFISKEEVVPKLIDAARRQKIAFTFAHQGMSQIENEKVRQALHRTAILAEPINKRPHHWRVTINHGDPEDILPPNINFKEHYLRMSDEEWQAIMDDMHTRFSPEPKTISHNSSEPLPDADAR